MFLGLILWQACCASHWMPNLWFGSRLRSALVNSSWNTQGFVFLPFSENLIFAKCKRCSPPHLTEKGSICTAHRSLQRSCHASWTERQESLRTANRRNISNASSSITDPCIYANKTVWRFYKIFHYFIACTVSTSPQLLYTSFWYYSHILKLNSSLFLFCFFRICINKRRLLLEKMQQK